MKVMNIRSLIQILPINSFRLAGCTITGSIEYLRF